MDLTVDKNCAVLFFDPYCLTSLSCGFSSLGLNDIFPEQTLKFIHSMFMQLRVLFVCFAARFLKP